MKKVNFKTVLMALFVAFAFLFVGVNGADAQTLSGSGNGLYAIPQGDFVSANDAQSLLEQELIDLKDVLATSSNATVLAAAEKEYKYYEEVDFQLKNGAPVPKAIVDGLTVIAPDTLNGATPAQQEALKQEVVDLLSI